MNNKILKIYTEYIAEGIKFSEDNIKWSLEKEAKYGFPKDTDYKWPIEKSIIFTNYWSELSKIKSIYNIPIYITNIHWSGTFSIAIKSNEKYIEKLLKTFSEFMELESLEDRLNSKIQKNIRR